MSVVLLSLAMLGLTIAGAAFVGVFTRPADIDSVVDRAAASAAVDRLLRDDGRRVQS